MNTKYRASPNPGPAQISPKKEAIARGEFRAKTMIKVPLQSGTTLPPLAEDITRETALGPAINYSFKIQIKPEWAVLVTEQLGQGAMGMVFKGIEEIGTSRGQKELGGEVAIKIIHLDNKDLGSDPERARTNLYEKFRSEVILLKKLNNDHIVRINAFGVTESPVDSKLVPYYTMDFLPGKDLEAIIKKEKTLPWERVRHLMLQVCDALEDAHEYEEQGVKKPIIHRDIKPGNIFITSDKRGKEIVKVLDFGIATIIAPQKKKESQDHGIWGTLEYMSPEQATGKETDHRTDVYAVGSMMYHLLSGRTVFSQAGTMEERLNRIINDAPSPIENWGIDFPLEVENILFKCLEKDPKKRFQSVRELQSAIYKINGKEETTNHSLESQKTEIVDITKIHKPKKNRTKLLLGLLALTGLVAGTSTVAVLSRTKAVENKPVISIRATDSSMKKQDLAKTQINHAPIDAEIPADSQPSIKYYSITLQLNTEGVRATMQGGDELCTSSSDNKCSFAFQEASKSVKITLSKAGYFTKTLDVTPDFNKEIIVNLERKRIRTKSKKPKVKPKSKFLINSE